METRLGIDIGGTFTDLVFLNSEGRVLRAKVLSTPDDYSLGIAAGLETIVGNGGVQIDEIAQIMHGTTVATNAILERKGARVALITTQGFRDVLEIRRLRMPVLYDIRWRKPPALVPRRLRFEVDERINHLGRVERALDEAGANAVIDQILAAKVDAIAICLINSYASGAHELRLRDLIRARDASIPISVSSTLLPEIREYERTSTTVVNAYVLPLVRHYLQSLEAKLQARKLGKPLTIMQSSGGAMSATAAAERPIHIIESGPAAGVVGAAELARRVGNLSLLSFDMGGTTAKAALIEDGRFLRVNAIEVGGGINIAGRLLSGGGYPVRSPAIDIAEVGAGGGSMARLDPGGALRVGPESAGAVPGPVCYDRRGVIPTVTDANVILGFINPIALAGGGLPVRRELAVAALQTHIARPLGLGICEAAWGVHRLANATMARALRAVSTERGRDPRDLVVLAFGGNGPVHAATLARLLDIRKILVPPLPGLFSALGMLFPEIEYHYVRTCKQRLDSLDIAALEMSFSALEAEGAAALISEGYGAPQHRFERLIDLRYAGANSELTLPCPASRNPAPMLGRLFGEAHERQYGYRSDAETVETMNVRVIARAATASSRIPDRLVLDHGRAGVDATRAAYFGPEFGSIETPVCVRSAVGTQWRTGPLLIEEFDSTTVVPPDGRARLGNWDTIEIELE
ncbi:MAG: hydantoinase/oxoprolinase family protein [Betaproteobacteria bacterium]|nr:MAG: hydantoinase/oxoprolinase family protein [Betaproteobacteria bacterium]